MDGWMDRHSPVDVMALCDPLLVYPLPHVTYERLSLFTHTQNMKSSATVNSSKVTKC